MGTIVASEIIDEAATILFDKTKVRWPESDLLAYMNAGQYQVVCLKPEANIINASVAATAGDTKQSIPADGVQFMRLNRNMGGDGSTPGKAIRTVSMDELDAENPDWHTDTAADDALHYAFRESDPKHYYVWPKPTVGRQHELVYSAAPVKVATVGAVINIDDIYRNALVNWTLYMAYRKNNSVAGNSGRAQEANNAFYRSLGLKEKAEDRYDPNAMAEAARGVSIQ